MGWRYNQGMRKRRLLVSASILALSSEAWALPTFTPGNVSLLNQAGVESLIKTVALGVDHRAYAPATPLPASIGLDVGVDLTGIETPASFKTSMAAAGVGSAVPNYLAIPRLNLHKGCRRGPTPSWGFR